MQQKRKGGDDSEGDAPPGLEQEDFDYEQQELAAVLEDDAPGKFTKVGHAGPAPVPPCDGFGDGVAPMSSYVTKRQACH